MYEEDFIQQKLENQKISKGISNNVLINYSHLQFIREETKRY